MRITAFFTTSALMSFMLLVAPGGAQEAQDAVGAPPSAGAPGAPSNDSTSAATTPAEGSTVSAHSKIRIVRLSEVKGEVQLDRSAGKGFETPMTNLPIVEGNRLKTQNGVAEVEFEDNSSVRIGPNSLVDFPTLEMLPGGAKSSAIHVQQGLVYVNLLKTKGNEFVMSFGTQTVNLPPDTHVRLQLTSHQAELAVLHGDAMVVEPAGITALGKNKTMTFQLADDSQPVIAKNVEELPLDAWDHDAVQYHKNFANATSFGNSPYSYGINDMNYYGSFINASGCGGSMWRPYFTSASWDPYGSGAWAYYPTGGYSWVSPYPWGWTPFHYGSWSFCQGVGWGWRPGGSWLGLANNSFTGPQNALMASSAGSPGLTSRPRPPVHAPIAGQNTLVPVNMKSMLASGVSKDNTFTFRNNSAGFGVPRGSLGSLHSFSGHAASHGVATTPIYYGGAQNGAAVGQGQALGSATTMRGGPVSAAGSSGMSRAPVGMSRGSYSGASQGPAGGGMSHASSGVSGGGGGHR